MGSKPLEVPAKIDMLPVGAMARYPFGLLRNSRSQCSFAAFSDSVS